MAANSDGTLNEMDQCLALIDKEVRSAELPSNGNEKPAYPSLCGSTRVSCAEASVSSGRLQFGDV